MDQTSAISITRYSAMLSEMMLWSLMCLRELLNEGINYPVDLKTNYIKRCVAVAGDTLVIKNQQVYTNGEALENHPEDAIQLPGYIRWTYQ